jgi:hypothetical protein
MNIQFKRKETGRMLNVSFSNIDDACTFVFEKYNLTQLSHFQQEKNLQTATTESKRL